jgi:hypothetical protein
MSEWREIPGFLLYEIDQHGNVRSWRSHSPHRESSEEPHLLAPQTRDTMRDGDPYVSYVIQDEEGVSKRRGLEWLLLAAWERPPEEDEKPARKDPELPPTLDNLKWVKSDSVETRVLLTEGLELEPGWAFDADGRLRYSDWEIIIRRDGPGHMVWLMHKDGRGQGLGPFKYRGWKKRAAKAANSLMSKHNLRHDTKEQT